MNFVVIILGVMVLLLLYYLITSKSANNLVSTVDLNKSNPSISASTLPSPGSTRYSYGLWVYVNTWSTNNEKRIISRGDDFVLSLDKTSPTLKCKFKLNGTPASKEIIITNNFPIQKWTYVIVSVDNQIIDTYLDGKLVLSTKLPNLPVTSTADISIGEKNTSDIFLSRIDRWTYIMDPQSAWNNYLKGNGYSKSSNYNLKLSVLQDEIEQAKFALF